jgi:ketosteroid isomerase-like protein
MSQENVELVLALQVGPDVDLVPLVRDDAVFATWAEAVAQHFHPDFECAHRLLGVERTYTGLDGLSESWRDWVAPWATYRAVIEEAIDCGDQVLVIVSDFGRIDASAPEVKSNNAAIWTIRDGKVVRAEFYADRARARKAVGLAE